MKKRRSPYAGTKARQRQIIRAALACFNEVGFVDTTMEDIRLRSGASNGSIYHHFKSKDQLAAALYLQGIIDYQTGLIEELGKHTEAREGIRAVVRFHLTWVRDHPDWSRYLFQMRHAGFMADTEDSIRAANKAFAEEVGSCFEKHVEAGTLRSMPSAVFISLLLGPCQEFARQWLARPVVEELEAAIAEIAEAAWQALRARR